MILLTLSGVEYWIEIHVIDIIFPQIVPDGLQRVEFLIGMIIIILGYNHSAVHAVIF